MLYRLTRGGIFVKCCTVVLAQKWLSTCGNTIYTYTYKYNRYNTSHGIPAREVRPEPTTGSWPRRSRLPRGRAAGWVFLTGLTRQQRRCRSRGPLCRLETWPRRPSCSPAAREAASGALSPGNPPFWDGSSVRSPLCRTAAASLAGHPSAPAAYGLTDYVDASSTDDGEPSRNTPTAATRLPL